MSRAHTSEGRNAAPDPLRAFYQARTYPAMSHPPSHPAVFGVLARLAGLEPAEPARMRVLELGCAGGWNLLPIAAAFPEAECLGVDFCDAAVESARAIAADAGLANVRFDCADLRDWHGGGGFDFILAHGVFSWVPDDVKRRVLDLCRVELGPSGAACVGFNTQPGWALRMPVVETVRALCGRAGFGDRPAEVLAGINDGLAGATTPHAVLLRGLVEDMLAKGAVLPFDDFAPVCDPFSLAQFVAAASESGLRWLGEAELRQTLPDGILPAGEAWLAAAAADPLLEAQLADMLGGRTHRNAVLVRADAPAPQKTSSKVALELSARAMVGAAIRGDTFELLDPEDGGVCAVVRDPLAAEWFAALAATAPACVPVAEVTRSSGVRIAPPALARLLLDSARAGLLELRTAGVAIDPLPPPRPALEPLRMAAVRRNLPVVDAFHAPCTFPAGQLPLLGWLDGSRTTAELAALARAHHPDLDFPRWLDHLARRGIVRHAG